ncbi:hypothetical protein FOFC_16040 [Fusarium oxysporum]|nr:hypothetical protein FOFC_16040 [Fusarium oxysporum]
MNFKLQAASCCLDDRQIEHEYKRPTLVAPVDRKSSAHLILAVHPCMRYHLGKAPVRSLSWLQSNHREPIREYPIHLCKWLKWQASAR